MVVVFSHCPSSVFTLNVNVLPITTENKIKTESRRIPSSIPENFKTVFLLILVFIFLKFKRNEWQTSVWSGFTFFIASLVMEHKGPLLVWFRANHKCEEQMSWKWDRLLHFEWSTTETSKAFKQMNNLK